jgi:hypothetical protein
VPPTARRLLFLYSVSNRFPPQLYMSSGNRALQVVVNAHSCPGENPSHGAAASPAAWYATCIC